MSKRPIPGVLHTLKIGEISGVDDPAQEGARALIMKRKHEPGDDEKGKKKKPDELIKRRALTSAANGHSHMLFVDDENGEINAGQTSYEDEHSHPWVRLEDGSIMIGVSRGHSHDIEVFSKNDDASASERGEPVAPEKTGKAADELGDGKDNGEKSMSGTNKAADELKAAEKRAEDAEKALVSAKAYGALTDAEKSHHDKQDDAGKAEFLAKSADERSAVLTDIAKQAADEDPVVFKSEDGTEFHKSDDPRLVTMAKQADGDRKARVEAEKKAEDGDLEKRAKELEHIPGDLETRKSMLKSIDGIADAEQREKSLTALKAQNDQLATAFKSYGVQLDGNEETGSAEAELTKMTKAHNEQHPDLSHQQAYAEVCNTTKGKELYRKSLS